MDLSPLIETLRRALPGLMAVYIFGSRAAGTDGPASDLDLAVLTEGYADPLTLWELSGRLADLAGCAVDLLDLRAASTVMQYQVITGGSRWWSREGVAVGLYECFILAEKCALEEARGGILQDVQKDGRIYG